MYTITRNFSTKKRGIEDNDQTMEVIRSEVNKMRGIRMKSRPAFYYLAAHGLKK
ncbi:MAG: DUF2853 family protein [Flavobacteriaceae bacterium]